MAGGPGGGDRGGFEFKVVPLIEAYLGPGEGNFSINLTLNRIRLMNLRTFEILLLARIYKVMHTLSLFYFTVACLHPAPLPSSHSMYELICSSAAAQLGRRQR